jgi:hypothetical protein
MAPSRAPIDRNSELTTSVSSPLSRIPSSFVDEDGGEESISHNTNIKKHKKRNHSLEVIENECGQLNQNDEKGSQSTFLLIV